MNTLRLSAGALAVSVVLAVAWMLGSGGCSGPNVIYIPNCFLPAVVGDPFPLAADGGPDPCHCDIPPPYEAASCPCTSDQPLGSTGLTGKQVFFACMSVLTADAGDAGDAAEGGPLAGSVVSCSGQCGPLPVPNWTGSVLLSVGGDGGPLGCPDGSPGPVWGGFSDGTFVLACSSNASGSCPDPGEICAPSGVEGFLTCVLQAADVGCPLVGPYGPDAERFVFYESAVDSLVPTTFCCIAAATTQ